MRFNFAHIIFLLFVASTSLIEAQNANIVGKILQKESGMPISNAHVFLQELNLGEVTDESGVFVFNHLQEQLYTLKMSCVGFCGMEQKVLANFSNDTIVVWVDELSFSIDELIVTAQEHTTISTTSTIDKIAMKHLQPASIAELFELLPGGKPLQVNYTQMVMPTIRQVGSDENSALGMLYVMDGMELSNDLNRQVPEDGLTDLKTTNRYTQGRGLDMREISTDEIEKVEIIRGVPSVRYGDVSSGVVNITRKTGATPVNVRLKADLNQKLLALGKGWSLDGHNVNLGIDYLNYKQDVRDPLNQYQRVTLSTRYKKTFDLSRGAWNVSAFVDYTGTLDRDKDDEQQLDLEDDSYRSSYQKFNSKLGVAWEPKRNTGIAIDYNVSASYSKDELSRNKAITPGVMPNLISTEEGHHRAEYLPSSYFASHTVEGKPLVLNNTLRLSKSYRWLGTFHHINAGAAYIYNKDFGEGQQFDVSLPMNPTSNARPYRYIDIPAIQKLSFYTEFDQHFNWNQHIIKLQAGFRAGQLAGIDSHYAMNKKWYPDPRINLSWSMPKNKHQIDWTFYAAYGWLHKFPVSAAIYPTMQYFDIIELNYYSQNPGLRSLFILTKIMNPVNYEIEPSLNKKTELGLKIAAKGVTLHLTGFYEKNNNGFTYDNKYFQIEFRDYDYSGLDVDALTAAPDTSDMPYTINSTMESYNSYYNLKKTVKTGLEYVMSFPKWKALSTNVSISGAWYKTTYDIEGEYYNKPNNTVANEPYSYVGVYDFQNGNTREELNTTVRFDTHISKLGLVVSNVFFAQWFTSRQKNYNDGMPVAYIDKWGVRRDFTAEDAEDTFLRYLVNPFTNKSYSFDKTSEPTYISLNQKISKELRERLVISFYVNNLIAFQPRYTVPGGTSVKNYYTPYFGAEINLKL